MMFRYEDLPVYEDDHIEAVSAMMKPLRAKHIETPLDEILKGNITSLLANRDRNLARPETEEKMGIAIYGESGAGKSRLFDKCIASHARLKKEPGAETMPIVSVRLQSPVRLKTAGFQTLKALGYPDENYYDRKDYWNEVGLRIRALKTQVIHFDEVHDIFISANVRDSRNILSMFKGLMTSADHPVVLILTGTHDLRRSMTAPETKRRLKTVTLNPVNFAVDADLIIEKIDQYCELAGIENGLVEEDYARIIHAAEYQFGCTFARALDGIGEALLAGSQRLERLHLAHAYARDTYVEQDRNIYVADSWRHIRPYLDDDEEQPAPKRKAPKRKDTVY